MKMFRIAACATISLCLLAGGAVVADDYADSVGQKLKFREAGFYATNTANRAIEAGIERFGKDEQERLFGSKTGGFLSYNVAITNNSRYRLYFSDLRIVDNATHAVVTRPDLDRIIAKNMPGGGGNKDHWRMAMMRDNLISKALQHKIIEPGQTLQGVLFVRSKELSEAGGTLHLRVQNLKRVAYLDFELPLTR